MSDISPARAVVTPVDITQPLERLRAGNVFVELRHDDAAARAAGLEALLEQLAGTETKIVWIGNPLRSPLTVERIFLQAAGPEADLRIHRSTEELASILRNSVDGSPRCLLILHQPETLDAAAREMLAAIAPLLAGATPVIQFLFCAGSTFRPIATSPAAEPIVAPEPPVSTPPKVRGAAGWSPRVPLLVLAVLAILSIAWVNNRRAPLSQPVDAAPVAENLATHLPDRRSDSENERTAPPPIVEVPPTPTVPPHTDSVDLRLEFESFLAQQSPQLAKLTPDQRDALFEEFLQRQKRRDSVTP